MLPKITKLPKSLARCLPHPPPSSPARNFFWTPDLGAHPNGELCEDFAVYRKVAVSCAVVITAVLSPPCCCKCWCKFSTNNPFHGNKNTCTCPCLTFDWVKRQKESNLAKNKCMANRTQDARYPSIHQGKISSRSWS